MGCRGGYDKSSYERDGGGSSGKAMRLIQDEGRWQTHSQCRRAKEHGPSGVRATPRRQEEFSLGSTRCSTSRAATFISPRGKEGQSPVLARSGGAPRPRIRGRV